MRISIELLQLQERIANKDRPEGAASPSEEADSGRPELEYMADENVRLRKALASQINQRAYFQGEYAKAQKHCAALFEEQHLLETRIGSLQGALADKCRLIQVHEQTNQSLQDQLADAHHDNQHGNPQQLHRLRQTINSLGVELEEQRSLYKRAVSERDHAVATSERQIQDLKVRIGEAEESWMDRVKILQEQLRLANNLKDEYKKRLKAQN